MYSFTLWDICKAYLTDNDLEFFGIFHTEENWPESVSDFIWDFSRTDSEDPLPKKLFAKVQCC